MAKDPQDIEDRAAVAAGITAVGCLSLVILTKLAVFAALIFGIVEVALFVSRQ